MTVDTMSMAVTLLESEGIFATVEYPGSIHVITGKSELFVFGTTNLPDCEDPVLVAEIIAKTVDPEGIHSFKCSYCVCSLHPGDKVVYTQNPDTSIDVFCTDACRQEAKDNEWWLGSR